MLELFLCHTAADLPVAETIRKRLETGAEARVLLEECDPADGQTVANRWDGGSSSGAILLLLSPDAVPPQPDRKHWGELLRHIESGQDPQVACLRLAECKYPAMLERKRFYRSEGDPREALRLIERWLLSLHVNPAGRMFEPAVLPSYQPSTEELEPLWEALVDETAMLRVQDPRLAQAFAKAASRQFRDTVWVNCRRRTAVSVVGEIGARLGLSMQCTAAEAASKVGWKLDEHRVLVILDGLRGQIPFPRLPEGRSSMLLIGSRELEPAEGHHSALWDAVACCQAGDFLLSLPLAVAGASREEARGLMERGWMEPLDADGHRFRRWKDSAGPLPYAEHAGRVRTIFRNRHTSECAGMMAEYEAALEWALAADWDLAVSLGQSGTRFLKETSRWPEAAAVCRKLTAAASKRLDGKVLDEFSWELSWIEDEPGRIRQTFSTQDQLSLF